MNLNKKEKETLMYCVFAFSVGYLMCMYFPIHSKTNGGYVLEGVDNANNNNANNNNANNNNANNNKANKADNANKANNNKANNNKANNNKANKANNNVMKTIDSDGSGSISFAEFDKLVL